MVSDHGSPDVLWLSLHGVVRCFRLKGASGLGSGNWGRRFGRKIIFRKEGRSSDRQFLTGLEFLGFGIRISTLTLPHGRQGSTDSDLGFRVSVEILRLVRLGSKLNAYVIPTNQSNQDCSR